MYLLKYDWSIKTKILKLKRFDWFIKPVFGCSGVQVSSAQSSGAQFG